MVVRKWDTSTMSFYREARSVIVSRRKISSLSEVETKRRLVAALLLLCCRLVATYKRPSTPLNIRTKMPTKPYQSKLIPFEEEIMKLRRKRPPVPYARIAEMLCQKHSIVIQPPAICKFIKVRKRGRKVYGY
jgi:hypothetical protein